MMTWPALFRRIERQKRQRRIASWLFRVLRFDEVEAIGIGEYAVAAGYVGLSNDLRAENERLRAELEAARTR